MNPAVIVPIAVAIVGPLITYLITVWRMSGQIGTSQAGDLWEESRSIRDDYHRRLQESDLRTRDLEARMARLEGENNALLHENIELRQKVVRLETTISILQHTIDDLQGQTPEDKKQ